MQFKQHMSTSIFMKRKTENLATQARGLVRKLCLLKHPGYTMRLSLGHQQLSTGHKALRVVFQKDDSLPPPAKFKDISGTAVIGFLKSDLLNLSKNSRLETTQRVVVAIKQSRRERHFMLTVSVTRSTMDITALECSRRTGWIDASCVEPNELSSFTCW